MTDIFISYRMSDDPWAAVLIDERLCGAFGRERVFRDSRAVAPGIDVRPAMWAKFASCKLVVVVIGSRWLVGDDQFVRPLEAPDDMVRQELAIAFRIGVRVLPVLIGDTSMPSAYELPDEISGLAAQRYVRARVHNAYQDIRHMCEEVGRILEVDSTPLREAASSHGIMARTSMLR